MIRFNVMIVDDEIHIRNGIKMKVDWEVLGMKIVAEAADGMEALKELEKGNIDIVITDINMPIMDGLAFIHKAREINSKVPFIIISGYSEFEYARSAMKLGVTDYLLKPIKETEIQAALLKVKERLMVRTTKKDHEKKELTRRREESLLQILTNKDVFTSVDDLKSELELQLSSEKIIIGVLKTDFYHVDSDSHKRKTNINQYDEIERLLTEQLIKTNSGTIIKCIWPEHEFVLLLQAFPDDHKQQKLVSTLNHALVELEERYGIHATIGLGEVIHTNRMIIFSYQKALFALKERILQGTGKVIQYSYIIKSKEKPNFTNEARLLVRLLEDRKWDQIKENINTMISDSITKGSISNHYHLYELFIELYLGVKKIELRTVDPMYETNSKHDGENIAHILNGFINTNQMVEWLYSYALSSCSHLNEGVDTSGKEIVHLVENYIKAFYSSDITLAKVSEKYHINPIYFSRIFKTYVGESFNHYITRIRMEEAKNLMETTSLRVQDISAIVGYEDPKYFSKVFKKFFGTSPSLFSLTSDSES